MLNGPRVAVYALGVLLLASRPLVAGERSFDQLLLQAQEQSAEGHRVAPPGDNLSETLSVLFKLVPTATAMQIDQLYALLNREEQILQKHSELPISARSIASVGIASSAVASTNIRPDNANQQVAVTEEKQRQSARTSLPAEIFPPSRKLDTDPTVAGAASRAIGLLAQGRAAENRGDISAARRFYVTAAKLKNADAAHALGWLYDPAYVPKVVTGGLDADPAAAAYWYAIAISLGDLRATPLLEALNAK